LSGKKPQTRLSTFVTHNIFTGGMTHSITTLSMRLSWTKNMLLCYSRPLVFLLE